MGKKRESEAEYLADMVTRCKNMMNEYPTLLVETEGLIFKITNMQTNKVEYSNRMNLSASCARMK